jgi:general secretion pathway protein E
MEPIASTELQVASGDAIPLADQFADWVVENDVLDEASVVRARRASSKTGERFDHVLAKLGLLSETRLVDALGRFLQLEAVTRNDIPLVPIMPETIRLDFIRARRVLPLSLSEGKLGLGVVDPLEDEPLRALEYLTELRVATRIMTASEFAAAVDVLYGAANTRVDTAQDSHADAASEIDVERLRDIANDAPVIRLVNELIATAVELKASDIHLEPGISGVAVRIRVNGDLRKVQSLNPGLRAAVTSRIKIMAKLDIAERRLPQDGRIRVPVRGVDIEFRVSTLPVAHGESVVMRVLDQSRVELDFELLGFDPERIESLKTLLAEPNGIILVTGPTGSGKTTTLYTALKHLNDERVKILTVEDPVEYEIAGLNQVQVHPAIGLDFPHVLRAFLRQNPNIVMVGEIRDVETARIAIETSLTGHLVLSTLHTNSAAASITRLIHMGIEDYLIASTVNAVLAQRLVRRLCSRCAIDHLNAVQWRERIATELSRERRDIRVLRPVGCVDCGGSGYAGRIAIAELMVMSDAQRGRVLTGANDRDLESAARSEGMVPLFADGLDKVARGLATIEDVLRVTRLSP